MKRYRGLLLLSGPIVAVALLAAAIAAHRRGAEPSTAASAPRRIVPAPRGEASAPSSEAAPAARRRPASPPPTVVISEEGRLRSVYQSYRTAIVTENALMKEAMGEVLARERAAAVWLAEEDLASCESDDQRAIARITLESLRR